MLSRKDRFFEFSNNVVRLFFISLLFFVLFGVFRILFLNFSENISSVLSEKKDFSLALLMGFRFDAVCIFYGLIPVFFVFLTGLVFSKSSKYHKFIFHFSTIYTTILFLLFFFILIVDFFFYEYFQTHISITIFGFWEDNTSALMKTFWTDYPVILIFSGIFLVVIGIYFLLRKIMSKQYMIPIFPRWSKPCIVILLVGIYFLGARGFSVGFPLRMMHADVSTHVFINSLVPNGIFALKTALQDKSKQQISLNIDETVRESGFSTIDAAISYYVGHSVINEKDSLLNALYVQTPENLFLEENPPHVIFILMEGFGSHLLSFHDKEKLNLMGELEDVLPDAYFFKNFISATQGTITSLEALMISNVFKTPVAQSTFANDSLPSSIAYVFKQSGYSTNFVSSAKLGWRNLNNFIPHQYFDNLVDVQNLANMYPNVEVNEWGCYDEYMFDYIAEEIDNASNQPQFIFGLTTTNHSPLSLPKSYIPYPVNVEQIHREINSDEVAEMHFTTYQYANDKLGKLIKKIKASQFGDKTIIVVTGDHSMRGFFNYGDSETLDKYAVPLLLFIPEKYKPAINPDLTNFGSHKDIFPTIFNLSLSKAKYLKSGVNLFSGEANTNFALHSSGIILSKNGCVDFTSSNPIYYTWNKSGKLILLNNKTNEKLSEDLNKAKAFTACMKFFNQTAWEN